MIHVNDIVTIQMIDRPKDVAIEDMKQEYKIVWEA